jgi:hypothetical protein
MEQGAVRAEQCTAPVRQEAHPGGRRESADELRPDVSAKGDHAINDTDFSGLEGHRSGMRLRLFSAVETVALDWLQQILLTLRPMDCCHQVEVLE